MRTCHKLFFLAFYILMLNSFLFSQNPKDTLNRKDANGLKQGTWQKRYETGMIQYEGRFSDDKPEGTFKYYYPEGITKAITVFEKGSDRSFSTLFSKGGKKMAEGFFNGQVKDSIWLYYSETGEKVSQESYRNGLKNGNALTWFDTGQVADSKHFRNDTLDGPWKMYYADQSPKSEGTYVKGLLEGEFRAWHSNGKLFITGTYKRSLHEGDWYIYDKEGKLLRIEQYSGGELVNKKILIPDEEDIDKAIKVDLIPE